MATKGLLARKIGMTQLYSEKGELLPVTVLEAGPCVVVARRSTQREGYDAIQLGFGAVKDSQVNRPAAGQFKKAGVKRDEVERGQVLARPGSITPHTRFAASVYVLNKDEGGRTVGAGVATKITQ